MNIIIVGIGKVGSTLAQTLTAEKHNITVIDKEQDKVDAIVNNVDCMGVVGNGAIQSVLLEAQVEKADYLIACTNSDEINILTCMMARKCSNCHTVARTRNPEYAKQIEYIMKELDISITINPELATAREITRITRYSQSITSDTFFKGRLNLLKVNIPDNSPIIGQKIYQIANQLHLNVLICVIESDDEIIIPTGNSVIKKGDKILFVADHYNAVMFFEQIGFKYKEIKSFMIVGAGKITDYLVDILCKSSNDNKIKVIEKDEESCRRIATKFDNISVVHADATDKDVLIKEGMNEVDAFITLTGIDEENIILSLFAQNNENTKIITKINHLNFINSLKDIKLGSIVNPEKIASDMILSYVRATINASDSNIETLYRLCDGRVEALGFKIKAVSMITNVKIKELNLKPNVLIAGIYRHGSVIRPNGDDKILVDDSVMIITKDNKFNDIVDIIED